MRTIARNVAVMCVVGVACLALPARADACFAQTVMVSFSHDYSEIVASTNVQFEYWSSECDQLYVDWVQAKIDLHTPGGTVWDSMTDAWDALATVEASYGEYGPGWYTAEGSGWARILFPINCLCMLGADYDYLNVPAPYVEIVDGPYGPVPQYSTGVLVTVSADPWYWAQHLQFQGCTPVQMGTNPNPRYCEVHTGAIGVNNVTAGIEGGSSDQWPVEIY